MRADAGAIWHSADKDRIKLRDTQITVGMKGAVHPRAPASARPPARFAATSDLLRHNTGAVLQSSHYGFSFLRLHWVNNNKNVFLRPPRPSFFKHQWSFI